MWSTYIDSDSCPGGFNCDPHLVPRSKVDHIMSNNELLDEFSGASIAQYASYHFEQFYDYSLKEYARWNRTYSYYYGDLLPANRSARILDLGCGGGRFLHFLKSVVYSNLAGADPDAKQLAGLCKTRTCYTYGARFGELLHCSSGQYNFISSNHC